MNLRTINTGKILQLAKEYIPIISFLFVFGYTLIVSPFAFNFENNEHGYYLLAYLTTVALFLHAFLRFLNKRQKIYYNELLVLIPLLFQIYYLYIGNEYASIIATCIIQFGMLKKISLARLKIVLYVIFACYAAEIAYAAYNLIFYDSSALKGTLHNTGVFAIYLIIFIPLCHYIIKKHLKTRYFNILFGLFIVLMLFFVLAVKSRTSLIALFLVFALPYFFFYLKKQRLGIKLFFSISAGLAFVYLFHYLFYLKSTSSAGRLLMLKVAFSHITEHFWWGVGLGKFTWHYPLWQAEFFTKNGHIELQEVLSAGDTYVIFNEFIQLFMTIGLVGFVLLGLCCIHFFNKKPIIEPELFKMIKVTFLLIVVCSLTYYAIHINVVLLLIALYMAISSKLLQPGKQAVLETLKSSMVKFVISISAFCALIYSFKKYEAINSWNEIKLGLRSPENELSPIYSTLKNDGKFLAEYGNYLYENGANAEIAINYYEKSNQTFISAQNIEDLAYLYLEQKKYHKAIEKFELIVNYIPCKFRNRLELLKLYLKISATTNAKKLAAYSLKMPIKIPSEEATLIKKEIFTINQILINQK